MIGNNLKIRKAVPGDVLGIAKAHVDSLRYAYQGLLPDERLAKLDHIRGAERIRESITSESEVIFVAEDDDRIVGFLAVGSCRDSGINGTVTGELYALYLVPGYCRQGIGTLRRGF